VSARPSSFGTRAVSKTCRTDRLKADPGARMVQLLLSELWSSAGRIRPEHVRTVDDIARLPTFKHNDIKIRPGGLSAVRFITGVSRADFGTQPLKSRIPAGGRPASPGRPWWTARVGIGRTLFESAAAFYIQGARPGDVAQRPPLRFGHHGLRQSNKGYHDLPWGVMPLTRQRAC